MVGAPNVPAQPDAAGVAPERHRRRAEGTIHWTAHDEPQPSPKPIPHTDRSNIFADGPVTPASRPNMAELPGGLNERERIVMRPLTIAGVAPGR